MSLYRKYRPQSFADVVGQEHVVTTLEQAAEQEKLAHAYLFAGSRGTGKTSVARILAKVLMIRGIADETLQKQIVHGVEEGTMVDLLEIDAASNRGIDDIRDLVEKIQFSPIVAAAKVYIIDEVHMLTKEAFNALLKTLEEPPPYAYFILATTEINKIPATIQSRCQRFAFHRIREEDIIRRLQYIADQEHIAAEREALRAMARHVDGGMRDAISLLDQMRSLPKITLSDVEERIGGTGQEAIEQLFAAIEARDAASLLAIVRKVEEEGIPLDAFIQKVLAAVRGLLHAAIEKREPTEKLLSLLTVLLTAIRDIRIAPVPGLVLESALLPLCSAPEEKEKESRWLRAPAKAPAKEVPASTEDGDKQEKSETKQTAPPAVIEAPEISLESLRETWPEILEEVSPPAVKMSLKNGQVHAVEAQKVTVSFRSSFHRDKVAGTEAARRVEEVMEKIFKRSLRLECVLEQERRDEQSRDEPVNLAEAAAEIF